MTKNLSSLAPPCFGSHFKPSQLHLQSLAPTNPHLARVVGCGPFCLRVIRQDGPSSGDVNRLVMIPTHLKGLWIYTPNLIKQFSLEDLDCLVISALRRESAEVKQRWSVIGPCFGRHVKPLVSAAFAVVSTHQPAQGPRRGLWPVLLMCNP
jgi:hypothetical protein